MSKVCYFGYFLQNIQPPCKKKKKMFAYNIKIHCSGDAIKISPDDGRQFVTATTEQPQQTSLLLPQWSNLSYEHIFLFSRNWLIWPKISTRRDKQNAEKHAIYELILHGTTTAKKALCNPFYPSQKTTGLPVCKSRAKKKKSRTIQSFFFQIDLKKRKHL